MRRIAVISLPLSGHLNPMGALVEGLCREGHEVCVIGPPELCQLAEQHMVGISTLPLSDDDYPAGRLAELISFLPTISGLRGVRRMIDEIAALSGLYLRQLPSALRAIDADLVLSDQLEPAAGLVARGEGLAHASLACALPMNRDLSVPPPYLGWTYRDTEYGRWLYQGGYRVVDWMMAPQADVLKAAAREYGLPERGAISDWVSPDCDLTQILPGLDYPRASGPIEIGPLRRDVSPFARLGRGAALPYDGRERVFCSLGTLMGWRKDVFAHVIRACAAQDVQAVIAHGGRLSDAEASALSAMPGRPIIRDFVDQRDILSGARASLLHGGLNSVLDSLAAGVPVGLMPMAFEQSAIAARVSYAGAGKVMRRPTQRAISRALDAVLHDSAIRSAAAGFRQMGDDSALERAVARVAAARPVPMRPQPVYEPGLEGSQGWVSGRHIPAE